MAPKNKGKKGKKGDDDIWYGQLSFLTFYAHNFPRSCKGIRLAGTLSQTRISLGVYQVKMKTIHQARRRELLASLPLLLLA